MLSIQYIFFIIVSVYILQYDNRNLVNAFPLFLSKFENPFKGLLFQNSDKYMKGISKNDHLTNNVQTIYQNLYQNLSSSDDDDYYMTTKKQKNSKELKKNNNKNKNPFESIYVTPPLPFIGDSIGTSLLINHTFGNSYYQPVIKEYKPIEDLVFTHVRLELKGSISGVQYDRLGHIFVNGNEVWRTSTPEPGGIGTYWSAWKDVTEFKILFENPAIIAFQLNNIISDIYYPINITLTAHFYYSPEFLKSSTPPSQIISLNPSTKNNKTVQDPIWVLPNDNAKIEQIELSKSVKRAFINIQASGNGKEEFWWGNTLKGYENTFSKYSTSLLGGGSFREFQLLITLANNITVLAGVAWPFEIIYTGGVSPGLWRPVVGLYAYDLPSYGIDITPWLPAIWQAQAKGKSKSEIDNLQNKIDITFKIVSHDGSEITNENWLVTASLELWYLDINDEYTDYQITTNIGTLPSGPSSSTFAKTNSKNSTLETRITADRKLFIESSLSTKFGLSFLSSWKQHYRFMNMQSFHASKLLVDNPLLDQNIELELESGEKIEDEKIKERIKKKELIDKLGRKGVSVKQDVSYSVSRMNTLYIPGSYSPKHYIFDSSGLINLDVIQIPNSTYLEIEATVNRGVEITAPYRGITTKQQGESKYLRLFDNPGRTWGSSEQQYASNIEDDSYWRKITTVNGTITSDFEKLPY